MLRYTLRIKLHNQSGKKYNIIFDDITELENPDFDYEVSCKSKFEINGCRDKIDDTVYYADIYDNLTSKVIEVIKHDK